MSNYYNKAYLEINYLVDQIKSLDIEEVIGRHLERKGRDYLCPFHNDIKGESFKILKQTNTYKCYSCGESGDAINFFQNMFNLTFKDAVLMIADEQGLYHSNDYLKTDRSYQVRKKESKTKKLEPLDPELLNKVYRIFIKGNTLIGKDKLKEEHLELLKEERNLTEEEIERSGYFTFPRLMLNRTLQRELYKNGIEPSQLKNVPGFYYDKEKQEYRFSTLKDGRGGIGIPIRNENNQIVGIQIRQDDEKEVEEQSNRYVWFSSSFADDRGRYKDGRSPGTPFDIVVPKKVKNSSIIITEGHFKAEAVAKEFGCVTISVQGVNNWKGIDKVINNIEKNRGIPVSNIIIAYDSDLIEKDQVLIQTIKLGGKLNELNTDNLRIEKEKTKMIQEIEEIEKQMKNKNEKNIYVARWNERYGKGIDDVINNGEKEHLRSKTLENFLEESKEILKKDLTLEEILENASGKVKRTPLNNDRTLER